MLAASMRDADDGIKGRLRRAVLRALVMIVLQVLITHAPRSGWAGLVGVGPGAGVGVGVHGRVRVRVTAGVCNGSLGLRWR